MVSTGGGLKLLSRSHPIFKRDSVGYRQGLIALLHQSRKAYVLLIVTLSQTHRLLALPILQIIVVAVRVIG